ncbi:hypothetical protein KAR91_32735 [Candidatus Pacearchaeota archaeon]|nr:hypothetical protein [Candidatus Pacearchaeota archaeon]
MTGAEIIKIARKGYLFDNMKPYTWDNNLLELFLNEAEREACRRSNLIIDKTTASDLEASPLPLCALSVVAETSVYTLSQKILRIKKCIPSWNSVALTQKTEGELDEMSPNWRTDTGTPIYFLQDKGEITLVPEPIANDTQSVSGITRSGTTATVTLGSHGYTTGKSVAHAGADQAEYNVTAVITKIDDDSYSYTVSGSPATPATGTITATLVDTLTLEVSRLPLEDIVLSDDDPPEISAEYHLSLINWMVHLALGNHDKDSEHFTKSQIHEGRFSQRFGPVVSARTENNRRRKPRNKGLRAKEFGFS